MTQKKISGYVIFMKEVLGKGSFGSVGLLSVRSTADTKMAPNSSAQSRC